MSTSNIESLIDSAENLISLIGYFMDENPRRELSEAVESLSVETRKTKEEMVGFSESRMLALEKEIDELTSCSSDSGSVKDNAKEDLDKISANKDTEVFFVGVEISVDKLIEVYGCVNNSRCSSDKAIKILNYIKKNYDGTVSVYRFAENVCMDLCDDNVLELLALSGEI